MKTQGSSRAAKGSWNGKLPRFLCKSKSRNVRYLNFATAPRSPPPHVDSLLNILLAFYFSTTRLPGSTPAVRVVTARLQREQKFRLGACKFAYDKQISCRVAAAFTGKSFIRFLVEQGEEGAVDRVKRVAVRACGLAEVMKIRASARSKRMSQSMRNIRNYFCINKGASQNFAQPMCV